jgi:hypothetical protein
LVHEQVTFTLGRDMMGALRLGLAPAKEPVL